MYLDIFDILFLSKIVAGSTDIEWRKYLSSLSTCAQRTGNIFKVPKIRVEVCRSNFWYIIAKLISKLLCSVDFLSPINSKEG